jgi:hypothetical protein
MSSVADIIEFLSDNGFTDTGLATKLDKINTTIYDICSREPWPFLEKSITLTFNGSSSVATNLPTDFRAALALVNPTTGLTLTPWRLDDFTKMYGSQLTQTGPAQMYYFVANQLNVWPVPPADETLILRYIHTPTPVTDATAEASIVVPRQHHEAILLGALYKLYDMEDDPDLAMRYQEHYESKLANMREDMWRKQYDRPDFVHVIDLWDSDLLT